MHQTQFDCTGNTISTFASTFVEAERCRGLQQAKPTEYQVAKRDFSPN